MENQSNMVGRERFLELSYKIFDEFYAKILQDYHAHQFFNSYFTIEHLIRKQSEALYKITKDIEEGRLQEAIKDFSIIARRHFELGINYKVIFDSIGLYVKLLKDFKEELGVKNSTILEIKNSLEHTTSKEYIKGLLESTLDFVRAGNGVKTYSRYDVLFQQVIVDKIKNILKAFEEVDKYNVDVDGKKSSENQNIYLESHIECGVGKLLHGIGFDIMTFENEKLKTETIAIHKVLHVLVNNLIKYYQSKEYEKAVAITSSIVNSYYELIYKYELIAKHWNSEKEKLIPKILESKKHKNKLSFLIISPQIETSSNIDKIIESIKDIIQKYILSFDFIYFTKDRKNLYVFLNKDFYNFKDVYKNIIRDLEAFAEDLESSYLDLKGKTIFFIYEFDVEKLLELTPEEMEEIINILKEEAYKNSKEKHKSIISIVNVNERKYELIEKARQEIELKNIVLEKVINKDIDLFVQWITDINLNKRFFEILARVKKGDGYIPAYKFIKILERENMMKELDIAVVSNLIQNIDKIKALTDEFYLNIYPPSLSDARITELLKELVKLSSSKEMMLNLELTEYAIMTSKDLFDKDMKNELFYIAYDDFGTGYTNYELVGELTELGIAKTLKIDGSIVKKILENEIYTSIVESISVFCKRTNLRVIYEFVDSENIIKELKSIVSGIGLPEEKVFFQGFYLHKPSPLEKEYEALQKV